MTGHDNHGHGSGPSLDTIVNADYEKKKNDAMGRFEGQRLQTRQALMNAYAKHFIENGVHIGYDDNKTKYESALDKFGAEVRTDLDSLAFKISKIKGDPTDEFDLQNAYQIAFNTTPQQVDELLKQAKESKEPVSYEVFESKIAGEEMQKIFGKYMSVALNKITLADAPKVTERYGLGHYHDGIFRTDNDVRGLVALELQGKSIQEIQAAYKANYLKPFETVHQGSHGSHGGH